MPSMTLPAGMGMLRGTGPFLVSLRGQDPPGAVPMPRPEPSVPPHSRRILRHPGQGTLGAATEIFHPIPATFPGLGTGTLCTHFIYIRRLFPGGVRG